MEKQTWFEKYKASVISVGIMFLLLVAAVVCHLFGWKDAPFQFLAACLGAGVTVIITNLLLVEQTKQQAALQDEQIKAQRELKREADEANEKRNKELQLRESKINAYSDFISNMYTILSEKGENLDESDLKKIRMDIFSKLIFYIEPDTLNKLKEESQEIKRIGISERRELFKSLSSITSILREEVIKEDKEEPVNKMIDIWENMSIKEFFTPIEQYQNLQNKVSYNFWHFNMWGQEQLEALHKGIYELNLVEYGEWWRTNLLKQVRNNDLIFLFQTGGSGYMGVFRAIGWRIFEFYDQEDDKVKVKETLNEFDKEGIKDIHGEEVPITEEFEAETPLAKDLKRSDIYNSREYVKDGATLCSSIIVEPLVFTKNGIGNPGGTYRRTISRYDYGYGIKQLARYRTIIEKYPDNYDDLKINNEKKGCNVEWFKKEVLEKGNIQPAEKDDNENWK